MSVTSFSSPLPPPQDRRPGCRTMTNSHHHHLLLYFSCFAPGVILLFLPVYHRGRELQGTDPIQPLPRPRGRGGRLAEGEDLEEDPGAYEDSSASEVWANVSIPFSSLPSPGILTLSYPSWLISFASSCPSYLFSLLLFSFFCLLSDELLAEVRLLSFFFFLSLGVLFNSLRGLSSFFVCLLRLRFLLGVEPFLLGDRS